MEITSRVRMKKRKASFERSEDEATFEYGKSAVNFPDPDEIRLTIFKFFHGWELTRLRLVCRDWNSIISNERSLWKLEKLPRLVIPKWIGLSSMRSYIQYMFIGVRNIRKVVLFFFKHPEFFRFICGLYLGHAGLKIVSSICKLIVGCYVLHRETSTLTRQGIIVDMDLFLDGYRQYILGL